MSIYRVTRFPASADARSFGSWRGISRQLARCSHPPLGCQVLLEEADLGNLLVGDMGIAARDTYDAGILGLVDDDRDQTLILQVLDVVLHLALADPQPLGEMPVVCDTAEFAVDRGCPSTINLSLAQNAGRTFLSLQGMLNV